MTKSKIDFEVLWNMHKATEFFYILQKKDGIDQVPDSMSCIMFLISNTRDFGIYECYSGSWAVTQKCH